jgi:shikimate 5-dehydrogenase
VYLLKARIVTTLLITLADKVVAIPEEKVRAVGKTIPEKAKVARYSDGLSVAAILAGHYQMNCLVSNPFVKMQYSLSGSSES